MNHLELMEAKASERVVFSLHCTLGTCVLIVVVSWNLSKIPVPTLHHTPTKLDSGNETKASVFFKH